MYTWCKQSFAKFALPDLIVRIPGTKRKTTPYGVVFFLVTRRGFEPRTHCLKGSCSAN